MTDANQRDHSGLDRVISNIKIKDMEKHRIVKDPIKSWQYEQAGLEWEPIIGNFSWSLEGSEKIRGRDGYSLGQIVHGSREGLTGLNCVQVGIAPEDITGVPYKAAESRSDCSTEVHLTERITLPLPIISSNMECVTDSDLAITVAMMGGMGTIHQFYENIVDQVREIERVKSAYENREVLEGIVQGNIDVIRSTHSKNDPDVEVRLNNGNRIEIGKVNKRIYEPAIDGNGKLLVAAATGLNDYKIRVPELIKAGANMIILDTAHGHSDKMIEAIASLEKSLGRSATQEEQELAVAGEMITSIREIKEDYPDLVLVAGNVITSKAAYELYQAGVDGIKAGVGPGQRCLTRKQTGFGVPMISGLYSVGMVARYFREEKNRDVFVIGDGGVSDSGTALKYLASVDAVMLGTKLAQTSNSPAYKEALGGDVQTVLSYSGKFIGNIYRKSPQIVKSAIEFIVDKTCDDIRNLIDYTIIYGSASDRAKLHQQRELWDLHEGFEQRAPFMGSTLLYLSQFQTGLQSGLSYAGTRKDGSNDISRFQKESRWIPQTTYGYIEGTKGF